MKNKITKMFFGLVLCCLLFSSTSKALAADQQIYLACSNEIQPESNWLDIYSHILVQDFPIRDANLLLNSVGVRLNNRGSSILVHAEIYTSDQHYIKQTATYVSSGSNWTYFYFGDKPIPVGSYYLWLWTNDGPGVDWGYANSSNCDLYGGANIDARPRSDKDMAWALYVKVVNPISGNLIPRSQLPHFQINPPQLVITGATNSDPASQTGSEPASSLPAAAPPADQLSQSQIDPDPSSVSSLTPVASSNPGTIEKIKDKVVSIFKPDSAVTEKPKDTWVPPTNDEILRMTYGDDYKNVKLSGFFPGTFISSLMFTPVWLIFLIIVVIIFIFARRRKAKQKDRQNQGEIKTASTSKEDLPVKKS